MAYASLSGRARTSPRNPQAHAMCDRCGFRYNHSDLRWQYDWRGLQIQNIRLLVCQSCYDNPQEQLRAISIPADPIPVLHPRVEFFVADETATPPTAQVGAPLGLPQGAVVPNYGVSAQVSGAVVPVVTLTSSGGTTVIATCNAPHGLVTGQLVSVEGLIPKASNAAGIYTITVLNSTTFSYTTASNVVIGSILSPTGRIVLALVGLPYNATSVPIV